MQPTAAGRRDRPRAARPAARRPPVPHARRGDAGDARARAVRCRSGIRRRDGTRAPRRRGRAAGDDARGVGNRRRARRRAAGGAQSRVSLADAVDDRVFAQAGGARAADRRHRPRGEESAERDDDSPRAAADEDPQRRDGRRTGAAAGAGHGGHAWRVSRRIAASPLPCRQGVLEHVEIIESEIRRLDEVVQGFLKFTRPEDLRLQPVRVVALFDEILPVVEPEAQQEQRARRRGVPASVPSVNGDAGDAAAGVSQSRDQRLPGDAQRRHAPARLCAGPAHRVEVRFEDTGVGIPPENSRRSLTCTSRRRIMGPASACRWSTASFSCMMARSKCSRRRAAARRSGCCCHARSSSRGTNRMRIVPVTAIAEASLRGAGVTSRAGSCPGTPAAPGRCPPWCAASGCRWRRCCRRPCC